MKISKKDKEATAQRIIASAVEVISKKGFHEATFKEIAKVAKVGDATIYKYFPTKENILGSYYERKMREVIERTNSVSGFNSYQFQEKVQLLLETTFELFSKDRTFIEGTYERFILPIGGGREVLSVRDLVRDQFSRFLDQAVEAGEMDDPAFRPLLVELLWDYSIGIMYYWIRDKSADYLNTTQLLDKSLGLISAALKSGIANRVADVAHFLVREHLFSYLRPENRARNFAFTARDNRRETEQKKPKARRHSVNGERLFNG